MHSDNSVEMELPQPSFVENLQSWLGGVVAVGTGTYAIWKGLRFSVGKAREVYRTLSRFADALDILSDLSRQVSRIVATQECYTAISHQAIWESDVKGHCLRANPAMLALIGINLEDMRGAGWANYLHPDDKARVIAEWGAAIESRSRFRARFRFVRPDGAVVPVDSECFPIRDGRGEVIGYLGSDTMTHREGGK